MDFENMRDWIFTHNGKEYVIGFYKIKNKILFIDYMSLKQHKLDGKGLGKKAFNELETYARSISIKGIYAELEVDTYSAKGFWEKMGFEVIKKTDPVWKVKTNMLNQLFNNKAERIDNELIFKEI